MPYAADTPRMEFDSLAYLYATQGTRYHAGIHRIIPPPAWLSSFSRSMRLKDLFMHRHAIHGTFVLCQWVIRPDEGKGPGLFSELKVLRDPNVPPPAHEMKARVEHPAARCRRIIRKQQDAHTLRRILKEDSEGDRMDTARYLRRRGMDASASLLERHMVPHVGKREAEANGLAGDIFEVPTEKVYFDKGGR